MFRKLAYLCLNVSAWFLIVENGLRLLDHMAQAATVRETVGEFSTRSLVGPFVIVWLEAVFWLALFRKRRPGARIAAAMAGGYILVSPVLGALIAWRDYGFQMLWPLWWAYFAAATAHLVYAFAGDERFADG